MLLAGGLFGCGTTQPASGTPGRYALVGCTYSGGSVTAPGVCDNSFKQWDTTGSYYQLDADGRVTLVQVSGLLDLGAGGWVDSSGGWWTESPGSVTVVWDDPAMPARALERVDAVTLRDNRITSPAGAMSFWFVKGR